MSDSESSSTRSGSTTWEWRKVRIPGRPEGHRDSTRRVPLAPRNDRIPLTVVVKYRGGAEAYWELRARGRVYRLPGHMYLHDAMTVVQGLALDTE